MATQFITLEEAARRLGIPAEEFKRRLKTEWTHVVPMRDGANLRFRENQIEELSRQLGAASDPELPLASLDASDPGSDDFKIPSGPKSGRIRPVKPVDEPLAFDGSDDDIFSLSAEPSAPKKPAAGTTDSDVRLESPKSGNKGGPNIPTEEIAIDLAGGPSSAVIKGGSSAKLSAPKSSVNLKAGDSGKKLSSDSAKNAGKKANDVNDSSEFELSLDADSDDFELQMSTDSSEEVDLGSSPIDEGGRAGKSGVNLRNPGDSGIPLEKGRTPQPKSGSKPVVDDSDDFELSLESDSGEAAPVVPKSAPKSAPRSGSKSAPKSPITSDSDSEFELTLDDSSDAGSLGSLEGALDDEGKGDIFETDFEIPNLPDESGSEAVALESDTDLEGASEDVSLDDVDLAVDQEESGSEAVVLEEEDEAPRSSARRRRGAAALDEDEDASSALVGVKGRRRDEDEDEDETVPAGAYAPPAPWGIIPALVLVPSFVLLIFGGLMSYELLHTMTGYAQPRKAASPIVRGVAKTLEMDVRDQ